MSENFQVRVPQMGEGLQYAKVVRILKNPGDRVEEDDDVVEVETEKAILGISTPVAGFVSAVSCRPGDTVNIGAVLLEIGEGAGVISLPQVRQERKGQRHAPDAAERRLPAEQLALIDYMRQSRDIVIPASLEMQIGWEAIDRIKRACRVENPANVPSSTEIICWAAARAMRKFDKLKSRLSPDNQLQVSTDSLLGIAVAGDDDRLETRVAAIAPHDGFDAARGKIGAALRNGAAGYHSLSVSDMSAFQVLRAQPVVVYPAVATLFIGMPHGSARETRVSNLVLAFDHRVMNGVYAAKFLKEIDTGIRHLADHLQQQPEKGKENVTEHGT